MPSLTSTWLAFEAWEALFVIVLPSLSGLQNLWGRELQCRCISTADMAVFQFTVHGPHDRRACMTSLQLHHSCGAKAVGVGT